MQLGIDATPLLGPRTGVGRYVGELVAGLVALPDGPAEVRLTAFTLRGGGDLRRVSPPGVVVRQRPVPARLLQAAWSRTQQPDVSFLVGRVQVFHGTNFVLPPVGRAAGVVTVHDLSFLRTPGTVTAASRRYRDLVPRSLARADVVCTPSRSVAEEVRAEYPAVADRVVATPLGVSEAWGNVAAPDAAWLAARGLNEPYLLFVGSLEPRKSVQTAVDAYRLAGPGADLPMLALAGPAGWGPPLDLTGVPPGRVVRLGHQDDRALGRLVAGARALLYPSRYEGFGLPVLEAFACGTPVIASDIPTTREVLGSGIGLARLFPVGDVAALAELITTDPGDDPADRASRRAVAANHTWTSTARATLDAYRRALG